MHAGDDHGDAAGGEQALSSCGATLRRRPCAARRGAPARRSARNRLRRGASGVQPGSSVRAAGAFCGVHGHRRNRLHRPARARASAACAVRAAGGTAAGGGARGGGGARSGGSGAGCAMRAAAVRAPLADAPSAMCRRWRGRWRRRRAHAAERRGRARRNRRARHRAGGGNAALVEHHAFDGAVGLVVRAAGDLRDGEPQLFEVDRVVDGPLHLERREARA